MSTNKNKMVELTSEEVLVGEVVGNPFFHYSQNNSGGGFVFDPARGISHHVIIQAANGLTADEIAEQIGLYFDGSGDCPCCGDRWSSQATPWSDAGDALPSVYSTEVVPGELMPRGSYGPMKWIDGPEGFIHFEDGRLASFWAEIEPEALTGSERNEIE